MIQLFAPTETRLNLRIHVFLFKNSGKLFTISVCICGRQFSLALIVIHPYPFFVFMEYAVIMIRRPRITQKMLAVIAVAVNLLKFDDTFFCHLFQKSASLSWPSSTISQIAARCDRAECQGIFKHRGILPCKLFPSVIHPWLFRPSPIYIHSLLGISRFHLV